MRWNTKQIVYDKKDNIRRYYMYLRNLRQYCFPKPEKKLNI